MEIGELDPKKVTTKRKNGLFVAKVFFGDVTNNEGMIFDPNKDQHIVILKSMMVAI